MVTLDALHNHIVVFRQFNIRQIDHLLSNSHRWRKIFLTKFSSYIYKFVYCNWTFLTCDCFALYPLLQSVKMYVFYRTGAFTWCYKWIMCRVFFWQAESTWQRLLQVLGLYIMKITWGLDKSLILHHCHFLILYIFSINLRHFWVLKVFDGFSKFTRLLLVNYILNFEFQSSES